MSELSYVSGVLRLAFGAYTTKRTENTTPPVRSFFPIIFSIISAGRPPHPQPHISPQRICFLGVGFGIQAFQQIGICSDTKMLQMKNARPAPNMFTKSEDTNMAHMAPKKSW